MDTYDRRAAKKPAKLENPVPFDESDEAIKHLVAARWIMKEWVTRASLPDMYTTSPERHKGIAKLFHALEDLTDKIRKL